MTPEEHLGLDGNKKKYFRRCKKCNRPTLGHGKPGYGELKCTFETKVDENEATRMYEEIKSKKLLKDIIEKVKIDGLKQCGECKIEFEQQEDFNEHIEMIHKDLERSGYKYCGEDYMDEELEKHMNEAHRITCYVFWKQAIFQQAQAKML